MRVDKLVRDRKRRGPHPVAPLRAFLRDYREVMITILAVTGIVGHLYLRYVVEAAPGMQNALLWGVFALGGVPLLIEILREIAARDFGADLLAGISIVASALLGQWLAGAIIILMLSGGRMLERMAVRRASSVLDALARRVPLTAHRKQ